jgi:hypothetical protein
VLACLFICFHIYGIKSKKQQIQIQLVDYLENYLTNRLMRTKEGSREWKILDEETENALVAGKGAEVLQADEDTVDLDADMEMLKRLLRQVEHKESGGTQNKKEMETLGYAEVSQADSGKIAQEREAAVSVEIEPEEIITQELTPEESELELLEEFVQSFLA